MKRPQLRAESAEAKLAETEKEAAKLALVHLQYRRL